MLDERLLKPYNPQETEDTIYKLWEESGFFAPETRPPWADNPKTNQNYGETFSIVLPPPNVTGTLHMGHAAMLAVEDAFVRYHRMRGFRTLWIPGTDHAAIATQSKVEKELYKKEGKTRHDMGREEFLKRVEAFANESRDTIVHQLKKMGSSLDWSREAFTLDKKRTLAVRTAFKRMYDEGLIYRGFRVVNWDPKGQTTISDDEVIHEERQAQLYTFKYSADFPIAISTTRPETKVGDAAIAVHPSDNRYAQFVGKTFNAAFAGTNLSIKIIADKAVDSKYGTGALGVTPAHSVTDADIASRHSLPFIQVIDERARMTEKAGVLVAGLKTKEAREKIVEWLKENDLLIKEETIPQNIATAERTGGIIEPLPKLQWFIAVNKKIPRRNKTLKELMLEPVKNRKIKIIPEHFNKIYFHWVQNLRDWCISRQIWYGHRIPVYYCERANKAEQTKLKTKNFNHKCTEPIVSIEIIEKCPHCGGAVTQDSDTLDTWFSSGLWTFATLGWPLEDALGTAVFKPKSSVNPESDLGMYHPTSLLETGYDILFFWVARMILMSTYLLGEMPFKTVYLHGLVRDNQGRKMSKSLGNIIDPLDMIQKYGADATRLSLIVGAPPGSDIKLSEDKVRGYKHFSNKLWNVARFVLSNMSASEKKPRALRRKDAQWIAETKKITKKITRHIEAHRLDLAAEATYHFLWHRFADVYIEEVKPILKDGNHAEKKSAQWTLFETLKTLLLLLHPFMPFVTEEIWSLIPLKKKTLLMVEHWPI